MCTGSADLPLHPGQCPRWLFQRMVPLSKAIAEAVVMERGAGELLRRLGDPYWFQAFACVIGFDWHSSGTTTTACGALKEALSNSDCGVRVAGGKGKTSLKTPAEITALSTDFGFSSSKEQELLFATRLSAKVDSSCVQDGFELYHHCFFLDSRGDWSVVQQGLNASARYARRYHWVGGQVESFVQTPHSGVACDVVVEKVLDFTSTENSGLRKMVVEAAGDEKILKLPEHHPVLLKDLGSRAVKNLQLVYSLQPGDFQELVGARGVGGATLRALALVSQLVYGTELDWKDPVKYSFAVGGKDGFPFPVDRRAYDESIAVLQGALEAAELGRQEKLDAFGRLARACVSEPHSG